VRVTVAENSGTKMPKKKQDFQDSAYSLLSKLYLGNPNSKSPFPAERFYAAIKRTLGRLRSDALSAGVDVTTLALCFPGD